MLKCHVSKKELAKTLSLLTPCIPLSSQNTLTSLQNVRIDGHKDGLFVSVNNLNTAIKRYIPAKPEQIGNVSVPASKMFQVVKTVSSDEILLETHNNHIKVRSGSATCNINSHPISQLPVFPEVSPKTFTKINALTLLDSFDKTINSVSHGSTDMYQLSSVAVTAKDESLVVIGCNGNKLTVVTNPIKGFECNDGKPFLIPSPGVKLMRKFLKGEETVQIGITQNQIVLKTDTSLLINQLQLGEYPQCQTIIDTFNLNETIIFKQNDIASALKRILLFTDNLYAVNFSFSRNKLTLASVEADTGTALEELNIEYTGENLKLTFNARFILETLNEINSTDTVKLLIDGVAKPLIIQCPECPSFMSLIMPLS